MESEHSSCGVGFLCSLKKTKSHDLLKRALKALVNLEHRGGTSFSENSGDGAGILVDIPWNLLGQKKESLAVGTLFMPREPKRQSECLKIFERIFSSYGLNVLSYRDVPVNAKAISKESYDLAPDIKQVFLKRPEHCRTLSSFDKLLYLAKQRARVHLMNRFGEHDFFFTSLSSRTITYKALSTSAGLLEYYPDLSNEEFKISFALFHRRFSTNTISTWDKVQPFRLIAHNGEINTISGNRRWAVTREKSLGLRHEELIDHEKTSDSGSFNGMVEALRYRSSNHKISEIVSLLAPPAQHESNYYKFWSRAMEPWDGPALIAYCDGKMIGARLDRNGFRPCRWAKTEDIFVLGSEAGSFELDESEIISKGALKAGESVKVNVTNGNINFDDPSTFEGYDEECFKPRLTKVHYKDCLNFEPKNLLNFQILFSYTREDFTKVMLPMAKEGKEAIGSMGDTAAISVLSNQNRSLFDYFYQNFAQVTNPPLDYIREKMVTDMSVYLCRKPNIFQAREMLPPPKGIELEGPVVSLGTMEYLINDKALKICRVDSTFNIKRGSDGLYRALTRLKEESVWAIRRGYNLVIISDRNASATRAPIPSLLALRTIQLELNKHGIRLRSSIIVETGEVRDSHQLSVLLGFGASAVCPWLALESVMSDKSLDMIDPKIREKNFVRALESGVLRIMAKMGISVLRSYQGSELFAIVGLGTKMMSEFFPKNKTIIEGLEIDQLCKQISENIKLLEFNYEKLENFFLYKEHPKESIGETHTMTNSRSIELHNILKEQSIDEKKWDHFSKGHDAPANIRDLFKFKSEHKDSLNLVSREEILSTFGAGAMSFGAISAESQRDLIIAMREIGGRSNSGEGGENPYFYTDSISANVKQIASGRFGVTAEFLVNGNEIQIKIAQGAKPGEGGQLMKEKVDEHIAKARFTNPGTDLISPPPMHDIYSIEDLKQLIYELKQLHPDAKISVKLVAGKGIGNISVGVVKAGADIIHISGGEGGTGAASLMSMKHCGIPWEIGLPEVHNSLCDHNLRHLVDLRVDGGLVNAHDILVASALGADGFEFGKMILIAQGCMMARVCQKNTCPAGIATHDPKFKARYKGDPKNIVRYFKKIAEDVALNLQQMGLTSLSELRGQKKYLYLDPKFENLVQEKNINLDFYLLEKHYPSVQNTFHKKEITVSPFNQKICDDFFNKNKEDKLDYTIKSTDLAIPLRLMGEIASQKVLLQKRKQENPKNVVETEITFTGSAGQGFASFTQENFSIVLNGEANDFVGKSMSGGRIKVVPIVDFETAPSMNAIVGNACFYGATGGEAFIYGHAGDRFAIRNSGADLIVCSVGFHACEYMTGGKVFILDKASKNIGAGMSGGVIYSLKDLTRQANTEYIKRVKLEEKDIKWLENQKHKFSLLSYDSFSVYKYIPIGLSK